MAGQDNNNTIMYEFQGNVLPLEKAFSAVHRLFLRYIKDAKAASDDGKLDLDTKDAVKELKNIYKRLAVFKKKIKSGGTLTEAELAESKKLFKTLTTRTKQFMERRDKLKREHAKNEKKEQESKQQVKDWTATSTQFRVGTQAEELQLLMRNLPSLPPNVIADINSYITAWKKAKEELASAKAQADGTAESQQRLDNATKALADATKNLSQKTHEYIPALKEMIRNQKTASSIMEDMLGGIISQITTFEFWFRKIKEGTQYLSDYIESINFLNVSLANVKWSDYSKSVREATKVTDEFTESLEQARWALGLDATETNTAAATFVSYANAMNILGRDAIKFSQNMTQLSIDMASLHNKDVIVMMTALRSALAGNTRAMMNYGISVHDATLNEWLLTKGVKRTMTQLSESSQVLVRYMYILEKTTDAQGDLARTLYSPANQIRVLRNQVHLLIQNLGALLNTVVYPAIRMLNMLLIPLNAFISALTSLASAGYTGSIASMSDDASDLADNLDDASKASKGLTALDEINQNTTKSSNAKIGIDPLIQSMIDSMDVYSNFMGNTSELTELMRALGEAMAPVWEMFTNSAVIEGITWCINALTKAFRPLKELLYNIKEGFNNLPDWLQVVVNILGGAVGIVSSLATTILVASAALAVFQTLAKSQIWGNFVGNITMMWKSFLLLGEKIYAAIAAELTHIKILILERLETVKTTVANNGLIKSFGILIKYLAKLVISFVKYILQLIKSGVVAVATAIKNLILSKSLWGVALGIIAAAGLAALAVAAVIGSAVAIGAATRSKYEETPAMAKGGVVTGPTFALIGEGQYNEAVIPLGNSPQMQELQKGIANEVVRTNSVTNNNNSIGGSATVQLNIDGRTLGRASINNIHKVRRQVGVDIK